MSKKLINFSPGSWAGFHKSGWIQIEIFTHPSKEKPILLLLVGYVTHVNNLKVIDLSNENNIITLRFPPHCTHEMQPVDVAFIKPLSYYYSEKVWRLISVVAESAQS